jgi:SP family general alpha glucoside:H+ symporter-like MFS transporter
MEDPLRYPVALARSCEFQIISKPESALTTQLIVLSFLAPESPWWLVRNGKLQEAEKSLKRLGGKAMQDRAHEQVANMVRTTQLEKDLAESTGSGRWIDIFKGVDLRRTEITVFVWVLQNFSGMSLYSQSMG